MAGFSLNMNILVSNINHRGLKDLDIPDILCHSYRACCAS